VIVCTATRPPVNWSSVANVRAASVGATKPGRCAISRPIRSVCAAAYAATCVASGVDDPYATRTRSNPASSWARANLRT
jgi:hypothetical protein